MPTYEFRCSNGHTFDQFHKISDAPTTAVCPICGAVAERAISGGAGLVFKGSGFYLTDYGRNAHRTAGSAPAAKGGEGGEAKGDAKGDAKSAAPSTGASGSGGEGGATKSAPPSPNTSSTSGSGGTSSGGNA